jgi:osmotically-inducible protein OsmY
MLGNQISDQELSKNVNKRLVRINAPPKVLAGVSRGTVTLSGQLKYENQRKQITKAVGATPGVTQVVDMLRSPPKKTIEAPDVSPAGH